MPFGLILFKGNFYRAGFHLEIYQIVLRCVIVFRIRLLYFIY